MKKGKIAFVVAVPNSASSFLKSHFEQLVLQYEVHLIANFLNEERKLEFNEMGITCHTIGIVRSIKPWHDFTALLNLYRLFKRERFSSVHSVTPKAGLLTALASWMACIKVRIHIYTGQVWATRKGIMRSMLKMMDKLIAIFATHILVDGESQRQFLISEGVLNRFNSEVLAHGSICGVKINKFNISNEVRSTERRRFGFKDTDVVFVYMGRLTHDKGIDEIYKAFNCLAGENNDVKLLFYGNDEGDYKTKVMCYANIKPGENYFYPGRTATPYESLQAGDVFVIPTWREGFGMSIIEAQALGLPVITSDAYGVIDASVDGLTGLRCRVNDPEGLYKCMKIYYQNPEMRIMHGLAGRRRVENMFDSTIVTHAWIEYYNRLVK